MALDLVGSMNIPLRHPFRRFSGDKWLTLVYIACPVELAGLGGCPCKGSPLSSLGTEPIQAAASPSSTPQANLLRASFLRLKLWHVELTLTSFLLFLLLSLPIAHPEPQTNACKLVVFPSFPTLTPAP